MAVAQALPGDKDKTTLLVESLRGRLGQSDGMECRLDLLEQLALVLMRRVEVKPALEIAEQLVIGRKGASGVDDEEADAAYANALELRGFLLRLDGHYEEALPSLRRALAARQAALADGHPDVSTSRVALSLCCRELCRLLEARRLLEDALAGDLEAYSSICPGAQHPAVARDMHAQASLLHECGYLREAKALSLRALAMRERFGGQRAELAESWEDLGRLCFSMAEYAESQRYLEQCLAAREQLFGMEHIQTASVHEALCQLYEQLCRLPEALALCQKCLDVRTRWLGAAHPLTAKSHNTLGNLMADMGRLEEAEEQYRISLAAREAALGPNHVDVAQAANNLGALLRDQSKFDAALALYDRSLEIRMAVYGDSHPFVAESLCNLANLHSDMANFAVAEPLYRRALRIDRAVHGDAHPHCASDLNNLGLLLADQGRYAEATPLFEQSLEIRRKVLGPDHPDTAQSLNSIANLLNDQCLYDEALPKYQQALAIRERVLGPDHLDVAAGLDNMGLMKYNQGLYDEAEPLFLRSRAIRERVLGPDHPDYAESIDNLAALFQQMGRLDEARGLSWRALEIRTAVYGERHPDVALSLNTLAGLVNEGGGYREAYEMYHRALEMRLSAFGSIHVDTATTLHELAEVSHQQYLFGAGWRYAQNATLIRAIVLGNGHDDTADSRALAVHLMQLEMGDQDRSQSPADPDFVRNLPSVRVGNNGGAAATGAGPAGIEQTAANDGGVGGGSSGASSGFGASCGDQEAAATADSGECSICYESYGGPATDEDDSAAACQLPCRHFFHRRCLAQWLNAHASCPVCRLELPAQPPPPAVAIPEVPLEGLIIFCGIFVFEGFVFDANAADRIEANATIRIAAMPAARPRPRPIDASDGVAGGRGGAGGGGGDASGGGGSNNGGAGESFWARAVSSRGLFAAAAPLLADAFMVEEPPAVPADDGLNGASGDGGLAAGDEQPAAARGDARSLDAIDLEEPAEVQEEGEAEGDEEERARDREVEAAFAGTADPYAEPAVDAVVAFVGGPAAVETLRFVRTALRSLWVTHIVEVARRGGAALAGESSAAFVADPATRAVLSASLDELGVPPRHTLHAFLVELALRQALAQWASWLPPDGAAAGRAGIGPALDSAGVLRLLAATLAAQLRLLSEERQRAMLAGLPAHEMAYYTQLWRMPPLPPLIPPSLYPSASPVAAGGAGAGGGSGAAASDPPRPPSLRLSAPASASAGPPIFGFRAAARRTSSSEALNVAQLQVHRAEVEAAAARATAAAETAVAAEAEAAAEAAAAAETAETAEAELEAAAVLASPLACPMAETDSVEASDDETHQDHLDEYEADQARQRVDPALRAAAAAAVAAIPGIDGGLGAAGAASALHTAMAQPASQRRLGGISRYQSPLPNVRQRSPSPRRDSNENDNDAGNDNVDSDIADDDNPGGDNADDGSTGSGNAGCDNAGGGIGGSDSSGGNWLNGFVRWLLTGQNQGGRRGA